MNGQKILNNAITLTREEAQQVLDALYGAINYDYHGKPLDEKDVECDKAADLIEARLAQSEQENDMKKYLASPNPWRLMP
jgi:hypothetical protein